MSTAKFKKGDKVIIKGNESGHGFNLGTEVRIHKLEFWSRGTSRIIYSIRQDDGKIRYAYETDLMAIPQSNSNLKIETMTKQTMKDAVLSTAKVLLVANNTITTLEIKLQLRKDYPYFYWTQDTVSNFVNDLVSEGKLTIVDDNGTYRTYADPTQPARVSNVTSTGSKTVTTKKVASTPTVKLPKGKKITAQKAVEMMKNNKGRFFTVIFTKKDNTTRTLNGQWVKDQKPNANGYVLVKDAAKMKKTPNDCIRNVNLQTLHAISINGNTYRVK